MIRMTKVLTTQPPSTTKPLLNHTSRNKTRPVFLSQPVDIFDEPNCDSTKAVLLEKDEPDPSPSPTVKSTTNLLGTKKAFTRVHSTFPEDSKKLRHKDVKMIPSTQHSTIGNHQLIPQPKPVHSPDICHSPDDPPQDVDKSHLSESTSASTNLNETCSLDTLCDHLLHLDSPSLSSELQDTQIVESIESESVPDFEDLLQLDSTTVSSQHTSSIDSKFVSESEEQLDNANLSPTDVFVEHHDYELFLLQKEIDAPYDNLSHQETHVCEKQVQDEFLIHATNLCRNSALPQSMAPHNCEDLKPIDTTSTCSAFTQDSSDHTSNPICAHNAMATQCNQYQYPTLLKQICSHNPSASQVSQANLSNSLTSQYPPDPGEHVLKKSATEIGEQYLPLKWFKFFDPSSKPRMTETSTHTPVHVAYSPIAFMNHQWTINLYYGYPPLHVLLPQEYIPPSLPTLCNLKSTIFHFGVDLLHSSTEPQHDLSSLASAREMVGSFSWTSFFKSPHQALYVMVNLHLQSSIKSTCCVKLCFVSPSFILYGTPTSILWRHYFLCSKILFLHTPSF